MSRELLLAAALVIALVVCAVAGGPTAGRMTAFKMREDFGAAPLSDCYLQYYYDIPCPSDSYFWAFTGGITGEAFGSFFEIGDVSTGTGQACDPADCHSLEAIRILDFAGYGTAYPGVFTIRMDVYCSDEYGCPVSSSLWSSGPVETHFGWNYIEVDPPLCLTPCSGVSDPVPSGPRILVTSTIVGIISIAHGMDNISTPIQAGCAMHDVSCLPALYPRPEVSHYRTVHSGFYGIDFAYCPPFRFADGRDTTEDASQFGLIELAWRLYLSCTGPSASKPTTWGSIKSMYR